MLNFEEMFPNWGQVTDCIYILSAVLYSTDWKYIIIIIIFTTLYFRRTPINRLAYHYCFIDQLSIQLNSTQLSEE